MGAGWESPDSFFRLPGALQDLWLGHAINRRSGAYDKAGQRKEGAEEEEYEAWCQRMRGQHG